MKTNPAHLRIPEQWLQSYQPQDIFDDSGHLQPELAALTPCGKRRMGANLHANGGELLIDLNIPPFTAYAIDVKKPATEHDESTRQWRKMLRDTFR